jgi:hypothetical protein
MKIIQSPIGGMHAPCVAVYVRRPVVNVIDLGMIIARARGHGGKAAVFDPALIPRAHGTVGVVESCKCGGMGKGTRCRAWMGSLVDTTPQKRRGSPPAPVAVIAKALATFTKHLGG